jgi:ATP-dependent Zn protease
MKVRILVFIVIATVILSAVSSSVSFAFPGHCLFTGTGITSIAVKGMYRIASSSTQSNVQKKAVISGSVKKSDLFEKGDKLGNDAARKERDSNKKLITVTAIVIFVWLFLGLFLFIIERKVSRLEKMIDEL